MQSFSFTQLLFLHVFFVQHVRNVNFCFFEALLKLVASGSRNSHILDLISII